MLRHNPAPTQIKPGGYLNVTSLPGIFRSRACGRSSIEPISNNSLAAPKLKYVYMTAVLGKVRCPLKIR